MISAVLFSTIWYFLRELQLITGILFEVEPMIVGLLVGVTIHLYGLFRIRSHL
jgi:hypothetical protein